MEELGYGDFPDIMAMAKCLSEVLDMVTEQAIRITELEGQLDGMRISAMTQTGGFMPRNRRNNEQG
jgi:hypothetical protein